jgi:dTMP kinase
LITFEGIDGAGKTDAIRGVGHYLAVQGILFTGTREPGGTVLSDKVRTLLLDPECLWTPTAELYLYMASRAQHYHTVIKPAIQDGQVVVCDRYIDSSTAYQAYGRHHDLGMVEQMNAWATQGTLPDLTFVLDIDPAIASERMKMASKADRLDSESRVFFEKVRRGYLALAARHTRFRVIDASQSQVAVRAEIIEHLRAHLVERKLMSPID